MKCEKLIEFDINFLICSKFLSKFEKVKDTIIIYLHADSNRAIPKYIFATVEHFKLYFYEDKLS